MSPRPVVVVATVPFTVEVIDAGLTLGEQVDIAISAALGGQREATRMTGTVTETRSGYDHAGRLIHRATITVGVRVEVGPVGP